MRLAGAAHAAGTGHSRATGFSAAFTRNTGREHGKFLGQLGRAAMRALRPLPIARTDEDFAVFRALGAMKFVDRHAQNVIPQKNISSDKQMGRLADGSRSMAFSSVTGQAEDAGNGGEQTTYHQPKCSVVGRSIDGDGCVRGNRLVGVITQDQQDNTCGEKGKSQCSVHNKFPFQVPTENYELRVCQPELASSQPRTGKIHQK